MTREILQFEEFPLHTSQYKKHPRTFKGPFRVLRLCLLGIVLPTILVSAPLYLRYYVYANQLYPFAVSDMRLLDRRVSTVWCQKQMLSVNNNVTFNAFLLSEQPNISPAQKPVSMVRDLLLEDDMKEYWGFYLLAGTKVTVSTCVRWPGASLIVIRGHKHLHECAYIGDDSSEELDELLETVRDGVYENSSDSSDSDAFANTPHLMKRHRPDVRFHHPSHYNGTRNHSMDHGNLESDDVTDPKLLKILLDTLSKKTEKMNRQRQILLQKLNMDKSKHKAATSTVAPSTQRSHSRVGASEELFKEISKKLDELGERKHDIIKKLNAKLIENQETDGDNDNKTVSEWIRQKRNVTLLKGVFGHFNEDDEKGNEAIEQGFVPDGIADHRGFINETTLNDRSNSEFWSSFSSSEEALLNCAGLILNLPLTPHLKCEANRSASELDEASLANTITYLVPSNGYYFFIFNSENEVQVNYIRTHFQLNKTMYDVSQPVSVCMNSTKPCSLDLRFFSNEKMVMELPVTPNESRWNEELVVVSECEPRTTLYACCVLSVPIIIILFAFQ